MAGVSVRVPKVHPNLCSQHMHKNQDEDQDDGGDKRCSGLHLRSLMPAQTIQACLHEVRD